MTSATTDPHPDDAAAADQPGPFRKFWNILTRLMTFYLIYNVASNMLNRKQSSSDESSDGSVAVANTTATPPPNPLAFATSFMSSISGAQPNSIGERSHIQPEYASSFASYNFPLRNLWRDNAPALIEVYFSTEEHLDYKTAATLASASESDPSVTTSLVWADFVRYSWDSSVSWFGNQDYTKSAQVEISPKYNPALWEQLTVYNATVYAHVWVYLQGASPQPHTKRYNEAAVVNIVEPITRYVSKPLKKETKKLLSASASSSTPSQTSLNASTALTSAHSIDENDQQASPQSITKLFVLPDLTIRYLYDFSTFPAGGLPSPVRGLYNVLASFHGYIPPIYFDRFWTLAPHFVQVYPPKNQQPSSTAVVSDSTDIAVIDTNEPSDTSGVNVTVSFAPISLTRWQIQRALDDTWRQQEKLGTTSQQQNDQMKQIVLDTNPVLIAVTILVSLAHSLFEFLAFKNDISHWRSAKNSKGMSIRTLIYNAFSGLLILLYLYDNETSFVVLISRAVEVAIEFWKISKARTVTIDGQWPFVHLSKPAADVVVVETQNVEATADTTTDKDTTAPTENPTINAAIQMEEDLTDEYDAQAYYYLSFILAPLALGYAVYSLMYNEFTSWYSFALQTTVSFIYTFGFIPMTAQLFINYRLKSTAHLPFNVFIYKALNTFVDDLFSFVIHMPMLHRLACLRDDVVFIVLLYQKWIYRTDYTRANEYGQVFDASLHEENQQTNQSVQDNKSGIEESEQEDVDQAEDDEMEKQAQVQDVESDHDDESDHDEPTETVAQRRPVVNQPTTQKDQQFLQATAAAAAAAAKKAPAQQPTTFGPQARPPPGMVNSKYAGEAPYEPEEVPQWVKDNQAKLRQMRQEQQARLSADPSFAAETKLKREEAEAALRQLFGGHALENPATLDNDAAVVQPTTTAAPTISAHQPNIESMD